mmetsp:Transcript_17632/g.50274  ORF Transcript_17632/g.50274 Transcript_17632/m.50274 type:complete len:228 (-) Transcript_17632:1226-1909(-)
MGGGDPAGAAADAREDPGQAEGQLHRTPWQQHRSGEDPEAQQRRAGHVGPHQPALRSHGRDHGAADVFQPRGGGADGGPFLARAALLGVRHRHDLLHGLHRLGRRHGAEAAPDREEVRALVAGLRPGAGVHRLAERAQSPRRERERRAGGEGRAGDAHAQDDAPAEAGPRSEGDRPAERAHPVGEAGPHRRHCQNRDHGAGLRPHPGLHLVRPWAGGPGRLGAPKQH